MRFYIDKCKLCWMDALATYRSAGYVDMRQIAVGGLNENKQEVEKGHR